MINNVLSEKDYQKFILERLSEQGYTIKPATNYDRLFAVDRKTLFEFLYATQPDEMEALEKVYKDELQEIIVQKINTEETKQRGSRLDVLKHGIEVANHKLELMYTKPATTFNKELNRLYNQNRFTVSEEVWASDNERIDLVIFLNGLAIIAFELKCNAAGQSYQDAIYQYRTQRNPKTRLFRWKSGVLVSFAMDLEQVYMTTKLDGESTFFLPFNMGKGEGIDQGAGNPIYKDKYSVYYMWEDILSKDTLLQIISKFMFIEVKEKKDPVTDKIKRKETVIFPRYHQLDCVRKVLADVVDNGTSLNYLIQHSAGSGKTNSIAWLAHRLASLHDENNKIIFDNIIICTDRVVVDRQLQKAIMGIEHKDGMIRVMDDKCVSQDLAIALEGNTKIIATTIQKFPYIVDTVKGLKNKKFGVIIDEAHSSTAGKNMAAITMTLGNGAEVNYDAEDMIVDEISKNGKQPNVSMFAFTATPKPTTFQLFGREDIHGDKVAFHLYSFEDKELHKKYNFLNYLISYIKINHPGGGYNLEGKIRATGFIQKKTGEYKKPQMKSDPVMKLPTAYDIVLTPAKEERLSQIIIEINNRTGRNYDNDVAIKAALQIRDIMKKSEELKTSAKNNTEQDFEFAFFDHVDDALIDGLEQNQDFFTLLLQNDEIKKEVLGLFVEDTYQSLRAVNA